MEHTKFYFLKMDMSYKFPSVLWILPTSMDVVVFSKKASEFHNANCGYRLVASHFYPSCLGNVLKENDFFGPHEHCIHLKFN